MGKECLISLCRGTELVYNEMVGNSYHPPKQIQKKSLPLAYEIEYSPETEPHLRVLSARQRAIVFDAADEQLAHEPSVETRNRKPMRPNPLAPWELRVGNLQVYYNIQEEPAQLVTILAVGVKDRNRVLIGGEEVEL